MLEGRTCARACTHTHLQAFGARSRGWLSRRCDFRDCAMSEGITLIGVTRVGSNDHTMYLSFVRAHTYVSMHAHVCVD